jgi:hypothetical protein
MTHFNLKNLASSTGRNFFSKKIFCLFLASNLVAFVPASADAACANPGADGSASITGIINTYYPGTATINAASTAIPVGAATGSATAIAAGDLLLIIQMQDATIDAVNSNLYGDGTGVGSGSTGLRSTGLYEYAKAVSLAGGFVTISGPLQNTYHSNTSGAQGQQTYQVIRVPQYTSVTINSGLTCLPWNGSTGGVLAFDASYTTNLNGSTVSLDGLGFRGGGARVLKGSNTGATTDYVSASTVAHFAQKGEGIAGTGA